MFSAEINILFQVSSVIIVSPCVASLLHMSGCPPATATEKFVPAVVLIYNKENDCAYHFYDGNIIFPPTYPEDQQTLSFGIPF